MFNQRRDTQPFEWYQTYGTISKFMSPRELSPENSATNLRERESKERISPLKAIPSKVAEFPSKDMCKVLIVGCGSSRLGEEMMKDGWVGGIVNLDYSKVVIEQMKKRHDEALYRRIQAKINREKRNGTNKPMVHDSRDDPSSDYSTNKKTSKESNCVQPTTRGREKVVSKADSNPQIPRMKFECVDATQSIPYPDASFDLIVNKGTMDSILCSNGAITNTRKMMMECSRVLKPHGSMIVVSHGKPDDRMLYFENDEKWWNGGVKVYKVPKPNVGALVAATGSKDHFIYVASK